MKVIKDMVHGYIEISPEDESVINSLHFQRLKDIEQLTAQHIFPSATHSRFEHSLGVMYLSRLAIENLRILLIDSHDIPEEKYKFLYFHLSMAALLHDIGHAPYSHLGEKYFKAKEIRQEIENVIDANRYSIDKTIFSQGANHELMSCYIVLVRYLDMLRDHIAKVGADMQLDCELLCRCIIGKPYNPQAKWPENLIIALLSSTTIDMDKLDYLMRDAKMTGISVPNIDISRLFRNIYINPSTKKITFCSQALSVIQNIIDERDALYLWVYNHHTVVYTDFIFEFLIKHMIYNFEESTEFADKLDPQKFFSTDAILTQLASSSDLFAHIKGILRTPKDQISKYSAELSPQIFERKFLKPLWKTIFEYRSFLEAYIEDCTLIKELEEKMCDSDYCFRRYVAKAIIAKCNINLGQVFIVPRSNKFYSLNPNTVFHVHLGGHDKEISKLLPQKDFRDIYSNVAFYVFCVDEKKAEVQDAFIQIVKEGIPNKDDLIKDGTELKWFG